MRFAHGKRASMGKAWGKHGESMGKAWGKHGDGVWKVAWWQNMGAKAWQACV